MSTSTKDQTATTEQEPILYGNLRRAGPVCSLTLVTATIGLWLFSALVYLWLQLWWALIPWAVGIFVLAALVWPSSKGARYKQFRWHSHRSATDRVARSPRPGGPRP